MVKSQPIYAYWTLLSIIVDRFISKLRGVWLVVFLALLLLREIFFQTANSVDTDKMPHFVTSDLGLHFANVPSMYKWVENG